MWPEPEAAWVYCRAQGKCRSSSSPGLMRNLGPLAGLWWILAPQIESGEACDHEIPFWGCPFFGLMLKGDQKEAGRTCLFHFLGLRGQSPPPPPSHSPLPGHLGPNADMVLAICPFRAASQRSQVKRHPFRSPTNSQCSLRKGQF